MAGSIRTVITENNLQISDATNAFRFVELKKQYSFKFPQVISCRGKLHDGRFATTYGPSRRDAVNNFLNLNRSGGN